MKIYTEEDFLDIIIKDLTPLSYSDFLNTHRLGKLWDKLESDDIRVQYLKTKENFYRYSYDLIHNKDVLRMFFQKRLSYVEPKPIGTTIIEDNTINLKSNNARFLRNINLPSALDTMSFEGNSLKTIYKAALEEGELVAPFTMPSTFKDIINGDYESLIVSLKTKSGHISIFSPSIYNALLSRCCDYLSTDKVNLLCPTASWCSPVLATHNSEKYNKVHIVDVQKDVLNVTEELHEHLTDDFFGEPYSLKTFCTASEKMNVANDYDLVFFCPPYYDLELYGGSDEQSTNVYDSYEKWLDGYWLGTVEKSYEALKKDSVYSFTIGKRIRGYNMAKDMLKIASTKFELIDSIKIMPAIESTRDSNSKDSEEKYEICYIMKKN